MLEVCRFLITLCCSSGDRTSVSAKPLQDSESRFSVESLVEAQCWRTPIIEAKWQRMNGKPPCGRREPIALIGSVLIYYSRNISYEWVQYSVPGPLLLIWTLKPPGKMDLKALWVVQIFWFRFLRCSMSHDRSLLHHLNTVSWLKIDSVLSLCLLFGTLNKLPTLDTGSNPR